MSRIGALIYNAIEPGERLKRNYRLSRWLQGHGQWQLAWLLYCRGGLKYHCYISPKAILDRTVTFPHPLGITIGEGTVVHRNVTIYQGVTLGLGRTAGLLGYPILEEDVMVFPNAVVAGPIRIGRAAKLGPGSVVRKPVTERGIVRAAAVSITHNEC